MADCSDIFLKFNTAVSINKTDRKYLRSARKGVTGRIKKYFSENKELPKVEFVPQGSFTMGTIVKPLAGDYDIDIGVYLKGLSNYRNDWPKPETVSQWLVNALRNHTSVAPVNKKNCIRVIYKSLALKKEVAYHVDLPMYVQYINLLDYKKTRIGINGKTQWSEKSDPVKFTKWFIQKCQEKDNLDKDQLVRIVKYIKAWKDYKSSQSKFPSGMILTILMAENYKSDKRDDIAFKKTIKNAYDKIDGLFGMNEIYKPVEPHNDLTAMLTNNQKKNFMKCFKELVDDAKAAIKEPDQRKSFHLWEKHFDPRFLL